MIDWIRQFVRSEEGPTATEYAVMLALIILVLIGVITVLGTKVNNMYDRINTVWLQDI